MSTIGTASDAEPAPSLRRMTLEASAWAMGGFMLGNALRLISNIILARLLVEDIGALGLMALVLIFMQGLQMFSDVGLNLSVIQNKRGDDPSFLRTAWTLQVIRGLVLWGGCWALATPFAAFYEEPLLAKLIPITGVVMVMNGFLAPGLMVARRQMDLKRLTMLDLASQVAGISVLLGWAFASPSVWALVAGNIAGVGFKLVASHVLFRAHAARFGWDGEAAASLLRFGGWIFVSTLLTFVSGRIDGLAFGKVFDVWSLGVFNVALMFAMFPTQAVQRLANQVVFPAYARVVNRGDDLAHVLNRVRRPVLIGAGAAASGLYASAPFLIGLLYLPAFSAAGWMLQLLAIGMLARVLGETSRAALLAGGRSRAVAGGQAMKLVGFAIAAPVGYHYGGMLGFVAAIPVAEVFQYLTIALLATRRGLHVLPGDAATCWTAAAGGGMGLVVGELVSGAMPEGRLGAAVALLSAGAASLVPWIRPAVHNLREVWPSRR